jgi:hypothetical protein
MKKRGLLLYMFIILTACANKPEVKQLPPQYPAYSVLMIKPPEINPEVYKGMDESVRKEFDAITSGMVKTYVDGIQEYVKGKNIFKELQVSSSEITTPTRALILETTFTKIKPGNKVGRFIMTYIVGIPGFGKPEIEIECRLVDANTGKKLDDKTERRNSSWRIADFKDDISIMYTRELAEECGELVEDYMQTDLNDT